LLPLHAGCMLAVEPMAPPYLRLRQIALVARQLEPVEQLTSALAAEVCFRDPGVGKYGLHNALWALGGTFLEVVAPLRDGTAAGRYLDRAHGSRGTTASAPRRRLVSFRRMRARSGTSPPLARWMFTSSSRSRSTLTWWASLSALSARR
jgi:hypothetical protein